MYQTQIRARKYANGTWQQALLNDSYLNGIILTFIQFYENKRNSKIIDRISSLNPYH
jgi:lantibiotic modifying enzyme